MDGLNGLLPAPTVPVHLNFVVTAFDRVISVKAMAAVCRISAVFAFFSRLVSDVPPYIAPPPYLEGHARLEGPILDLTFNLNPKWKICPILTRTLTLDLN